MSTQGSFPYRLAAIDLDETLLGPDKQISAANVAAVQALRDRGVRVILASGRRHENMLRFHVQLGLEGPIVSCQGALTKHAETGQILHRQCVPADLAAEVVVDGLERDVTPVYYHLENTYVSHRNTFTALYGRRTGTPVVEVDDLTRFAGNEPLKILWIHTPEYIGAHFPALSAHYRGRLEVVVTDPEYLEFNALGVSKAVGLAAVADHYGIERSEVLTFGDGNNDVTMLEWAGFGVAMDHARPSAKAAANRIAPEGDPASSLARAVDQILAEYDAPVLTLA